MHFLTNILFNKSNASTVEEGDVAFEKGNFREAISIYRSALKINDDNPKALSHLGNALAFIGKFRKSEETLRKAIELDSSDSEAFYFLGNVLGEQRNNEGAVVQYINAIEANPLPHNLGLIYHNLGYSYSILENDDKAIEAFTKAIELLPDYADAYYHRSVSFGIKQMYIEAEQDSNKVIELDSEYSGAYYVRGVAKYSNGDTKGAIDDLGLAKKLGYGKEASIKLKEIKMRNEP